jgi:hypothetical protein
MIADQPWITFGIGEKLQGKAWTVLIGCLGSHYRAGGACPRHWNYGATPQVRSSFNYCDPSFGTFAGHLFVANDTRGGICGGG